VSKIIRRETVALILLPLLYLYIMKLSEGFFFVLVLFVSVIAIVEFCSFYKSPAIITAEAVFFSSLYLYESFLRQNILFLLILVMTITFLITRLFITRQPQGAIMDIAPGFISFFYIAYLLQFALFIRTMGPEWIIYLFATVWSADSMAYYIGKTFGKHKLYPSVSPKKTWEGVMGSFLGGILASLLMMYLLVDISWLKAIMAGTLVAASSILGDLIESMFKRDAGVKDSSGLIPAHGGILDKIDGMLICCPVIYFFFQT